MEATVFLQDWLDRMGDATLGGDWQSYMPGISLPFRLLTETAEITVIGEFLPTQLTPAEVQSALDAAITEAGATGIRDMGRVMAALKARYTGQMDFGAVGPMLKARLG